MEAKRIKQTTSYMCLRLSKTNQANQMKKTSQRRSQKRKANKMRSTIVTAVKTKYKTDCEKTLRLIQMQI